MSAGAVLTIDDLTAGYGPREVLHGVSIEAPAGTVVSLLGANGAGKTSLLRAIVGRRLTRRGGTVSIDGRPAAPSVAGVVRRGVSYVPEGGRVFPELSVGENLRLGAYLCDDARERARREATVLELFPILGERRKQQANLLSGGERQMLALGRALMAAPKLLLLDEPYLGLAPVVIDDVNRVITEIARTQGVAVLVAEQSAKVLDLATRVYLMRLGRIVHDEPEPERLRGDREALLQEILLA